VNPITKFGIFVALAAVLSVLFALFPEHPPADAMPLFSLPESPAESAPAKATPESATDRSAPPAQAPLPRGFGPVVLV